MDPGVVLIGCMVVLGVAMGSITLLVGYIKNPPRPPWWIPNPHPGRSPYFDRGRSWSDLIGRAVLVGVAAMFCLVPGIVLLAFAGGASATPARQGSW